MNPVVLVEIAFTVVTVSLAALVAWRAELTRARGGKVFAFLALFILPVLAVLVFMATDLPAGLRAAVGSET